MTSSNQRPERPPRVLFVSSVTSGGSGRSQRELASALVERGWEVEFLVDDEADAVVARRILEELTDVSVRLRERAVGRVVDDVRGRLGRRTREIVHDGLVHHVTVAPENAASALLDRFRPATVVASSISRATWRAIRTECRRRRIPTVLYLREATAIGHLTAGLTADLLVANSHTLVVDAARHGALAELVPSVIHVEPLPEPPTGDVALLVNPVATHGVDIVEAVATARPDIPLVLQESWPLDPGQQAEVDRLVVRHPNVAFRAYEPDAARIFRDARLLLVPHRIDNRPRTVLEAQVNGIPVVASDHPGLVEQVGDGGLLVDRDAGGTAWATAVGALWDDDLGIERLSALAVRHARRPEVRPDLVVDRFEELLRASLFDGSGESLCGEPAGPTRNESPMRRANR